MAPPYLLGRLCCALAMVSDEVIRLGAREIRSAVLYAHTWGQEFADYIGIVSDALILNPWDREIVQDGKFVPHPEYLHALRQQGLALPTSLVSGIEPREPVKESW